MPVEPTPRLVAATAEAGCLAEHVAEHLSATYWRYRSQWVGLRAADAVGPG